MKNQNREKATEFLEKLEELIDFSKKDLKNLKVLLEKANTQYYTEKSSFLSDDEFDKLLTEYKRYRDVEPLNFLQDVRSFDTSKKIKQNLNGFLCTVEKVYSPEELCTWIAKRKNFLPEEETLPSTIYLRGSHKYDGCSIAIEFKKGRVERAFSRGQDGEGQDYSKWFEGKEYKISNGIYKFEAIMTWIDFEAYNSEYSKDNERSLAHPRNAVAGILNGNIDKTTKRYFSKYISFVPLDEYGLILNDTLKDVYLNDKFKNSGLKVVDYVCWFFESDREGKLINTDKDEPIFRTYSTINATRDDLAYPIDGLVFELVDSKLISKLGFGEVDGKPCPKFAVGLKFPYKTKNTILENIEFDVADSPTGRITPCACFKPVTIDGRVFKRVSLSNFDRFQNEKFFKGEEVTLTIRGDVLGYISKFPHSSKNKKIKEEKKEYFTFPKTCPVCGGELNLNTNETWLFCINANCPRKKTGSILNYLEKMRIKNIGPNTIEFMADNNYISNIVDLYRFDDEQLKKEEGFGEKSVQVILTALNERRKVYDYEFFGALGWEGLSRGVMKKLFTVITVKELLGYFHTKLSKDFKSFIITSVEGFSSILANNLHRSLVELHKMDKDDCPLILIDEKEIELMNTKSLNESGGEHYKVVVTGDLNHYKRDVFKILIEKKGHSLISAVSNKTDYVITNFPNSGTVKVRKARELGVPVINEDEAIKLFGL